MTGCMGIPTVLQIPKRTWLSKLTDLFRTLKKSCEYEGSGSHGHSIYANVMKDFIEVEVLEGNSQPVYDQLVVLIIQNQLFVESNETLRFCCCKQSSCKEKGARCHQRNPTSCKLLKQRKYRIRVPQEPKFILQLMRDEQDAVCSGSSTRASRWKTTKMTWEAFIICVVYALLEYGNMEHRQNNVHIEHPPTEGLPHVENQHHYNTVGDL